MTSTLQPERTVMQADGEHHTRPSASLTTRIAFFGTIALLCALAWGITARLETPMAAMSGMPMAGGWSMSMMWMRMPGQTWAGAVTAFMAMWLAMMAGMMLPVLAPALWQQHRTLAGSNGLRKVWLNLVTGSGYFLVWAIAGLLIWIIGRELADLAMQHPPLARHVPLLAGSMILVAGLAQFSPHKMKLLVRCHHSSCHTPCARNTRIAWWQGIRHGWSCNLCCANLTLVLLVCGMMDWTVMSGVTGAILMERWSVHAWSVRGIGVLLLGAGLWLVMHVGR
ncbi:DUF2182 domain-containing protein [Silvimonas amylolytica]|uniref:Metal-binding membrane protein n=1 Tax=Silvimonas amylolytica TaxID=449663 RepID=A0ABQ2PJ34_9NEIS|nr:DUF2182 domain-containing protein [Silvimonas amylolytica]GGP25594.1 hypothetical protein GCM10010971_14130 [Silvimonas amylolytica]